MPKGTIDPAIRMLPAAMAIVDALSATHVSAPRAASVTALPARGRLAHVLRGSPALLAFACFVLACLWGAIVLQIHAERAQALQAAEVNLANLTRAFAEHTAKCIEGADQAIRFIRNEYLAHPRDLDIAGYLQDKQIIGEDYHQLAVIGADGMVSYSSLPFARVDLSDREHFRVHAKGHDDVLFVSKPVRGRVSHKLSIQLTRRVDRPDRGFGGVVVVSLSPEYLTSFYRDVDLGAHGAITLIGYDGVVRARASPGGTDGAQDVSRSALFQHILREKHGTVVAPSSIDGLQRVWAFRALEDDKLIVVTGMGVDDLMADVERNRRIYLVVGALLTLIIAGFAVGLARRESLQRDLMGALARSNLQANAASEMKSRFLASVSHELRTPLNGILGYSELVRDDAGDRDSRQYGQIIHQSAQHLLELVNTVLDLAKIESGRMVANPSEFELGALLDEVRQCSAGHAQSRGLALRTLVDAGVPARVASDRMRLLQILNNLVNNALKFSDAGEVTLSARRVGARLVLEVADSGRGMSEQRLATVFDRFHPEGIDGAYEGQGAGLGLPLCRELVELLGGTIAIDSRVGAGTRVAVTLPLAPAGDDNNNLGHSS
jgi:two-component system sensor histidine kinase BarA